MKMVKKLCYGLIISIFLGARYGLPLLYLEVHAEEELSITTGETAMPDEDGGDFPTTPPSEPKDPSNSEDPSAPSNPWGENTETDDGNTSPQGTPSKSESPSSTVDTSAWTKLGRKRLASSDYAEKCFTVQTTDTMGLAIARGDETPVEEVTTSEEPRSTFCHTYSPTHRQKTQLYEVSLQVSSSLFMLDLSEQQLVSLSEQRNTPINITNNCIETPLLETGTLLFLDTQYPNRSADQGVCMGNLLTKGINPELAFGRIRLYGNEDKKADLTTKYRYTLGHMFTENEVYTLDLSELAGEILNLPNNPIFNAKAIKLWFLRVIDFTSDIVTPPSEGGQGGSNTLPSAGFNVPNTFAPTIPPIVSINPLWDSIDGGTGDNDGNWSAAPMTESCTPHNGGTSNAWITVTDGTSSWEYCSLCTSNGQRCSWGSPESNGGYCEVVCQDTSMSIDEGTGDTLEITTGEAGMGDNDDNLNIVPMSESCTPHDGGSPNAWITVTDGTNAWEHCSSCGSNGQRCSRGTPGGDGGYCEVTCQNMPTWSCSGRDGCDASCSTNGGVGTETRTCTCPSGGCGTKPSESQYCYESCYGWNYNDTWVCNKPCGGGQYIRDVRCEDRDGNMVSDYLCGWGRPGDTYSSCNTHACLTCKGSDAWNYTPSLTTPISTVISGPVRATYSHAGVTISWNPCTISAEGGTCTVYISDGITNNLPCTSANANNIDNTGPVCGSVTWTYSVNGSGITTTTRTNQNVRALVDSYANSDAKNNPVTLFSGGDCTLTTNTEVCQVELRDALWNPSTCPSKTVYIDKIAPNCRVDSYSPATWPVLPPVTITVKCIQDNASPIHIKNLSGTVYTGTTSGSVITITQDVYNNGQYTFPTRDDAGNTSGVVAEVKRIWIAYDIRYTPGPRGPYRQTDDPQFTGHRIPTSGDVQVEIIVEETGVVLYDCDIGLPNGVLTGGRFGAENTNEPPSIPAGNLGNSTGFVFTVTKNGSGADYQICYESADAVTGVITPDIYRIDKDPPECTITYIPPEEDWPTDEYVMAHLECTDYSDRWITNNDGSPDHLFTDNGEFDFRVIDEAGNATGARAKHACKSNPSKDCSTKAEVDRIIPRRTIEYEPPEKNGLTSGDVEATITLSRTGVSLTFVTYDPSAGTPCATGTFLNTGTTPVLPQALIDAYLSGLASPTPPLKEICYPTVGSGVTHLCVPAPSYMQIPNFYIPIHPGVLTGTEVDCSGTGAVTVKTVWPLTGNTYTFTVPQNGRYLFTYNDNSGSTGIGGTGDIPGLVTRIDKIPPQGVVTYNPPTRTSGAVTATITLSESGTIPGWNKVSDLVWTKVYHNNRQESVPIYDLAKNANTVKIDINWIYSPGGPGSITRSPDNCPNGDNSPSAYDGLCDGGHAAPSDKCSIAGSKYTNEENEGYLFACERDITTMRTIQAARIHDNLTRAEMAKIISVFATRILGREVPNNKPQCRQFADLHTVNEELQGFITTACEIEQMGYRANGVDFLTYFRPNDKISRAEVWIIISRVLRGTKYAGTENYWYQSHLNALKTKGVMNYIDNPFMREIRGNVFIMLHRLYSQGHVQALHGASSTINDFVNNSDARGAGYAQSATMANTGTDMKNFIVVAPSSVKKGTPIDLMVSASKGSGTNTSFTGNLFISIPELTPKDYTITNQGRYKFTLTDQGRKLFTKGLTINKAGIYTIQATNDDDSMLWIRRITVLD